MTASLERLVDRIKLPEVKGLDLDAPEAIAVCRNIIQKKPFLRRLYLEYYGTFQRQAAEVSNLPGALLELGSGGGFLKDVMPQVVTSDVCAHPHVERVLSAEQLPFPDGGLKAIFMLNVLHHLPDAEAFFREAQRCLTAGGRLVMIEPHRSFFGRLFYKYVHHEPFEDTVAAWSFPRTGRLSSANDALPWIIFWRDRARFTALFPKLQIRAVEPHTVTRYVLSGGLTLRSLAPAASFGFFRTVDALLSRLPGVFPMYQTIILERLP